MLAGGATFTRGAKVRGWLRLVLRCDHRTMRGMSPRIQMRIVIITRVSKSFKPSAGARRKRGHGGTAAMPLHGVESSSLHGFKPSSRSSANRAGNPHAARLPCRVARSLLHGRQRGKRGRAGLQRRHRFSRDGQRFLAHERAHRVRTAAVRIDSSQRVAHFAECRLGRTGVLDEVGNVECAARRQFDVSGTCRFGEGVRHRHGNEENGRAPDWNARPVGNVLHDSPLPSVMPGPTGRRTRRRGRRRKPWRPAARPDRSPLRSGEGSTPKRAMLNAF